MSKLNYIFPLLILLASCHLSDPTQVINSGDVLTLTAVDSKLNTLQGTQNITADSLSYCLIKVNLGIKSDGGKSVTLHTTDGVLTNTGQMPISSSSNSLVVTPLDREIIVQLNALDVSRDNVTVAASTDNVYGVLTFKFTTAYAKDFQVDPRYINAAVTDTTQIQFTVLPTSGTISENQNAEISFTPDSLALNCPQFVKIKNQAGTFSIVNTSGKTGTAVITIKVPSSESNVISKTVTVKYE